MDCSVIMKSHLSECRPTCTLRIVSSKMYSVLFIAACVQVDNNHGRKYAESEVFLEVAKSKQI